MGVGFTREKQVLEVKRRFVTHVDYSDQPGIDNPENLFLGRLATRGSELCPLLLDKPGGLQDSGLFLDPVYGYVYNGTDINTRESLRNTRVVVKLRTNNRRHINVTVYMADGSWEQFVLLSKENVRTLEQVESIAASKKVDNPARALRKKERATVRLSLASERTPNSHR